MSGKVGTDGKYDGMEALLAEAEQPKLRQAATYEKRKVMEAYNQPVGDVSGEMKIDAIFREPKDNNELVSPSTLPTSE